MGLQDQVSTGNSIGLCSRLTCEILVLEAASIRPRRSTGPQLAGFSIDTQGIVLAMHWFSLREEMDYSVQVDGL